MAAAIFLYIGLIYKIIMEISESGSILNILIGSTTYNYPKNKISFMLSDSIEVRHVGKPVAYIKNNSDVTNIASSSMADLFSKLLILIS